MKVAVVVAAALAIAGAAHAQPSQAVTAKLAELAARPRLDRADAIDLMRFLVGDGLTAEDGYLLTLLSEDGDGDLKLPLKGEVLTLPRPTYDAQRLMQRLTAPLDLTSLWLKGPESMSDLRDLAAVDPQLARRITDFIAFSLSRARDRQAVLAEARAQFGAPGLTVEQIASGHALLDSALARTQK